MNYTIVTMRCCLQEFHPFHERPQIAHGFPVLWKLCYTRFSSGMVQMKRKCRTRNCASPPSFSHDDGHGVMTAASTGDGRWAMGDGRWEMGNGRWAMEDGRWAMGDVRRTMAGGRVSGGYTFCAALCSCAPLCVAQELDYYIL